MLACLSCAGFAAEPSKLIDIDDGSLFWDAYQSRTDTCVLRGKAVSEMRDDAFEVQFRHSRGQPLRLFVLIPGLPKGGSGVHRSADHARSLEDFSTDNYVPALSGERAEALRRNVAVGIPIEFTFEYGQDKCVQRYETAPRGCHRGGVGVHRLHRRAHARGAEQKHD